MADAKTKEWADKLAEALHVQVAQHGSRNAKKLLRDYQEFCAHPHPAASDVPHDVVRAEAGARSLGIIKTCAECPNRRYYSAGRYVCSETETELPEKAELYRIGFPSNCPLTPWPLATPAPSTSTKVQAWPDFVAAQQYADPVEGWEDPRLPDFRRIWSAARECGYAVGLHGSMRRDCDLIAAPWTGSASSASKLIAAICNALGARQIGPVEDKPAGRIAVTLQVNGYVKPIDLSVMPTPSTSTETPDLDAWAYAFANWRQGQRSTPSCEAPGAADIRICRDLIEGMLACRDTAHEIDRRKAARTVLSALSR